MRLPRSRPRKALTSHEANIREDSVADLDIPPEGSNFICSSVLYLTFIFRWKDTKVYSQTGWGWPWPDVPPWIRHWKDLLTRPNKNDDDDDDDDNEADVLR